MIRVLLFMLLMINIAYASNQRYFIKFGSFKQLQGLERSINKMPYSLRSHVIIVRSNGWYIPFAYYTQSKKSLYSKIASYKRYFPDAHINHSRYMLSHPIIRNYGKSVSSKPVRVKQVRIRRVATPQYQNTAISEEDNTLNIPRRFIPNRQPLPTLDTSYSVSLVETESHVVDNVQKIAHKQHKSFNKIMLSGNYYYLAYKSTKNSPNLLIKVNFGNHKVTYQPIIGDMQMTQANYLIENDKLYMFSQSFTKDGAYSTLDEHRSNHFLVSSWSNGKKLNTLRYYYRLNDAKEYLGLERAEGLASSLSDGEFDDFFLEEN